MSYLIDKKPLVIKSSALPSTSFLCSPQTWIRSWSALTSARFTCSSIRSWTWNSKAWLTAVAPKIASTRACASAVARTAATRWATPSTKSARAGAARCTWKPEIWCRIKVSATFHYKKLYYVNGPYQAVLVNVHPAGWGPVRDNSFLPLKLPKDCALEFLNIPSSHSFPLPSEGPLLQQDQTELHRPANEDFTVRHPRREGKHRLCYVSCKSPWTFELDTVS